LGQPAHLGDGRVGVAPPAGAQRGVGNMRKRAQQLGGTLDLASDMHGTRVTLRVAAPPTLAPS
jgi:signal transduction histidine kinase